MNKPIRIKPFHSAGEVFKLPDSNEFQVLPVQVFQTKKNGTIFRVGDTIFCFDENGVYTGTEVRIDTSQTPPEKVEELKKLLQDCEHNTKLAPVVPYFAPGSIGHTAETAGWPKRTRD